MSIPIMCQIFAMPHRSLQKQLISLIENLLNLVRDFYGKYNPHLVSENSQLYVFEYSFRR